MVRGRRPRMAAPSSVRTLDDQYCASPKRKESKIDPHQSPRRPHTPTSSAAVAAAGKTPEFGKTRARAITHYFPFAQKEGDGDNSRSESGGSPPPPPMHAAAADYDENACDSFELLVAEENAMLHHHHHQHQQHHHHHKHHASTNIFLQAPVLHLNIDRSPNQASSITINKQLEVMSNFAALAANSVSYCLEPVGTGHGHANGSGGGGGSGGGSGNSVAGSETDRSDDDGHVTRSPSSVSAPESSDYVSSDSNSCDSGVVADRHKQLQQQQQHLPQTHTQLSPSKRRKPMTPHRIVCPSPDKRPESTAVPDIQLAGATADGHVQQQQQQQQSPSSALSGLKIAGLKNPKARRRLNVNKRAKSAKAAADTVQIVGKIPTKVILTVDADVIHINDDDDEDEDGGCSSSSISSNATSTTTSQTDQILTNPEPVDELVPSVPTVTLAASEPPPPPPPMTTAKAKTTAFVAAAAPKPKDKLTDFFPVRRSVRKTKKAVELEQQRSIEAAIRNQTEEGLVVTEFPQKGRGIMAARRFERGEFVVEYIGELISMPEANRREQLYAKDENTGCYMYYFKHGGQQYCIDATAESGKLGRLVNHSRNGNLVTKTLFYRNRPHLVLLAKDTVEVGEELTYDYGDRSKESLLHHPWLAL